jgi:CRISPR-associated protein Csh2
MSDLKNRREIIFLYDVKDANPNGDPDESNRPRMDHEGHNIVTDVRLKRTIRDHWISKYDGLEGKEVLVKRSENVNDGTVRSMGDLIKLALNIKDDSKIERSRIREEIPKTFIDTRFFGGAITLTGANVSITGPVQFGIGRSLNQPTVVQHTITTTFSSGEGKGTGTFGETHMVDYSLIAFPGIVAETTAKETKLMESDLPNLWDGLWNGTKNLNTRSKFNHNPRLLLVVISKEAEFQIGGLSRLLKVKVLNDKQKATSEKDVVLVLDDLVKRLKEFTSNISQIEVAEDKLLQAELNGSSGSVIELLKSTGIEVKTLVF